MKNYKNYKTSFVSIVFFITISFTNSFALDRNHINELTVKYSSLDSNKEGEQNTVSLEFETYHRYNVNDYLNLTGELGFYKYPALYEPLTDKHSESQNIISLNELLMNVNINNSLTLSVGQMPAHDGAFSSIKTNNFEKSDLLFTVVDNAGQGVFLTYNKDIENSILEKVRIRYGQAEAKYYPLDNDEKFSIRLKGTSGRYVDAYLKFDKIEFLYNYMNLDIKADDNYYLSSEVNSYGIKYDDISESGLLLYGIYSESKTNGIDSTSIIHPVYKILVTVPVDLDGKGSHNLLGVNYHFDIANYDSFVGFEKYCSTRKNMVFNNGNPNSEYGLGLLGNSKTTYIGTNLNTRLNLSIEYKHTTYDYARSMIGTTPYIEPRVDVDLMFIMKYLF